MNVLYSCCIVDPYLDVAIKLESQLKLKPVYWVGDIQSVAFGSEDEEIVKKSFPEIVYQKYFDAWKGVFPGEVEEIYSQSYIDIDFIKKFSFHELQALSMMDRIDYDRYSFCYMERERYYHLLIKKWTACIKHYGVDLVISANNPHRVFDYVLYLVCRQNNINFVSFQFSMDAGRIFPVVNFSDEKVLSNILDDEYSENLLCRNYYSDIPQDVLDNYNRLTSDYNKARPRYMALHDVDDVKNRNFFFLMKRYMKYHSLWGENSIFRGQTQTIYKNRNYSIEQSKFSLWEWFWKRKKTLRYNKTMCDFYCKIASDVNYSVPYILFFLHYQPEETTSPTGGIFANQLLCIETLLNNTPSEVFVYVKEHPNQFMSHMQGHTKRIKDFYTDLLKNPRIRFVPFEIDSFTLMSKALAVSTVTGTVGWEAAVRKKPVIVFGLVWYERMKGVLRITDNASAKMIYSFIKSYKHDEHAIFAYLYTFSKHSILAYHYQGYKDVYGYSHNDTVDRIYNSLLDILNLKE